MTGTAHKVRQLSDAAAWRARQLGPVVFTNGVFDLLHPGHVELLELAREEGTSLIVGINSDGSVRRLGKGLERPFMAESARARVVAGLVSVDCLVIFDEDTPMDLIKALEPDVLVKGADYAKTAIVGAEWIEARGGRVVRVPLVAGFSTTSLVERFRATSR